MLCDVCNQTKRHFIVIKLGKNGPTLACKDCYKKIKQQQEIKNEELRQRTKRRKIV